jgi:hypothetical protein
MADRVWPWVHHWTKETPGNLIDSRWVLWRGCTRCGHTEPVSKVRPTFCGACCPPKSETAHEPVLYTRGQLNTLTADLRTRVADLEAGIRGLPDIPSHSVRRCRALVEGKPDA